MQIKQRLGTAYCKRPKKIILLIKDFLRALVTKIFKFPKKRIIPLGKKFKNPHFLPSLKKRILPFSSQIYVLPKAISSSLRKKFKKTHFLPSLKRRFYRFVTRGFTLKKAAAVQIGAVKRHTYRIRPIRTKAALIFRYKFFLNLKNFKFLTNRRSRRNKPFLLSPLPTKIINPAFFLNHVFKLQRHVFDVKPIFVLLKKTALLKIERFHHFFLENINFYKKKPSILSFSSFKAQQKELQIWHRFVKNYIFQQFFFKFYFSKTIKIFKAET